MKKMWNQFRINKNYQKAAAILCVWLAAFLCGRVIGIRQEREQFGQGNYAAEESNVRGRISASKESAEVPEIRKEVGEDSAPKERVEADKESGQKPEQGQQENNSGMAEMETESETETETETETAKKDYIRWVEFNVTKEALQQAYEYDIRTYNTECSLNWIELLAYLGTRYGGDFKRYKASDMTDFVEKIQSGEKTLEELTRDLKYYPYYLEAYTAVLGGMVGEYEVWESTDSEMNTEQTGGMWVKKYGLKAFHPIAKGFPYSDYDDFGVSRTYGYRRNHLGHDMMGQVGTPVIAVESGYVAALGWNQYGGWRIGINSFDGKRYYYYAHLRQNFPYAKWLKEGSIVQAGDVIGYMGRTGYSSRENVNNIDSYHLHFGLQLIFDESQREGIHEIWVSPYELVRFLYQNQSETVREDETKEWKRVTKRREAEVEQWKTKEKNLAE